jgi:hypothetical protein
MNCKSNVSGDENEIGVALSLEHALHVLGMVSRQHRDFGRRRFWWSEWQLEERTLNSLQL